MAAPSSILVATDLSDRSDIAVARAAALAREHGAKLWLVSAVDEDLPGDFTERFAEMADGRLKSDAARHAGDLDTDTDLRIGDPVEELIRATKDHAPDLVVMGVHRPRRFLDELRETTMQRVVRHLNAPVLLVTSDPARTYGRIVAMTDFLPASAAAAEHGHALAPDATVTPAHAVHVPYQSLGRSGSTGLAEFRDRFKKQARDAAQPWLAALKVPSDKLAQADISTQSVGEVIERNVGEVDGILLTAGAHGKAGSMRPILGSLANDLVRFPPCDVLLARPPV